MNFSRVRRVTSTVILVPLIASCSMLGTMIGSATDGVKIAKGCPDLSTTDAIAKVNFGDEFTFEPNMAAQVKAGVIAAGALKDIAADVDADLVAGCGGLAKDLGNSTAFKTGKEACAAALKALEDAKAKLGAKVAIELEIKPPVCSVSLGVVSDCASKCDASLKGAKVDATCEGGELSGTCDGDCIGTCTLTGAAACPGTCNGSCDADFSGKCSGTCEGTCDNKKTSKASCAGTCQGKCGTGASGSCAGQCSGSCEMNGGAKCDGTCRGKCSVDLKAPVCSGKVVPPKVSAECKASCDAKANANLSCTPALVAVKISGTKDLEAAAKLAAALETNLPRILKVAMGMLERIPDVLSNAKSTVEGAIAAGKSVAASRVTASAHIGQCLLTPFEGAIDGIANIKSNVDVSLSVKAAVSSSSSTSAAATSG
ncbi:MAG TPA: hypothetical protein VIK01_26470 [Polyangiaceae bacterium]